MHFMFFRVHFESPKRRDVRGLDESTGEQCRRREERIVRF